MMKKWLTYSLIILFVLTITPAAFAMDNGDGEEGVSYFCMNLDVEHPVASAIAEKYDIDYDTVIAWFCGDDESLDGEKFGLGEIMLALQTSSLEDVDFTAEEILGMRTGEEQLGWGEIWQDLGLIGKPDHAGPPEWVKQGPPEWAGVSEESGETKEQGPPLGVGRPPFVGPPSGVGRP